ncbi:hypothetical protein C8F01DRAFT_1271221 [Mycena amicta]|nr:hypothetical protein C8F01DRAFT_1271221 [Mycena amicta]
MADEASAFSLTDLKVWAALKEHPALAELKAPRRELSTFMTKAKMTDYHLAQYCQKLSTTMKVLIASIVLATLVCSITVGFLQGHSQDPFEIFLLFMSLLFTLSGAVVASVSLIALRWDLNRLQQLIDQKRDFDGWIIHWELAGEHSPPAAYLGRRMRQWISLATTRKSRVTGTFMHTGIISFILVFIGGLLFVVIITSQQVTTLGPGDGWSLVGVSSILFGSILSLCGHIYRHERKMRRVATPRDEEGLIALEPIQATEQPQARDPTIPISTTPNAVEPAASSASADITAQPEADNTTSTQGQGGDVQSLAVAQLPVLVSESEISTQPPAAGLESAAGLIMSESDSATSKASAKYALFGAFHSGTGKDMIAANGKLTNLGKIYVS